MANRGVSSKFHPTRTEEEPVADHQCQCSLSAGRANRVEARGGVPLSITIAALPSGCCNAFSRPSGCAGMIFSNLRSLTGYVVGGGRSSFGPLVAGSGSYIADGAIAISSGCDELWSTTEFRGYHDKKRKGIETCLEKYMGELGPVWSSEVK